MKDAKDIIVGLRRVNVIMKESDKCGSVSALQVTAAS